VLDALKGRKKTIGIKQSLKAVEENAAEVVFIAKDADPKITADIIKLCNQKSIEIVYVDTMKLLGKASNIDVGASVVALLK